MAQRNVSRKLSFLQLDPINKKITIRRVLHEHLKNSKYVIEFKSKHQINPFQALEPVEKKTKIGGVLVTPAGHPAGRVAIVQTPY